MKKFISVFLLTFLFSVSAFAFSAGDKVMVEWKGKWYKSTVLKTQKGKYYIHYDGWASSWDEWVTQSRIKPFEGKPLYQVGDAVQIFWKKSWYAGKILKVKGDKYFIHYDGWSNSWDEWVGVDRLKKK